VVLIAAAFASSAYVLRNRRPALTSKGSIVIADFSNTTGDPVFDGTLRQGLVAQLKQSPNLPILSDEQIAGSLRLMGRPVGARLTYDLARELCQRSGGAAILDESIAQIGSQYQLVINISDCSSGALLASGQVVASDKNHVLGALGNISSSIRGKLGESLDSVKKFNTRLEEVTTPSLEALQSYTVGSQANLNGDFSAAVGSLERAISLDPNFAVAYSGLGAAYFNLNENSLAAKNSKKAYELRDQVSEQEKFCISSDYEILVTGDLEEATHTLELWSRTYDQDAVPLGNLAAVYLILGQYQNALVQARRALEIDPISGMNYVNLAVAYLSLDHLDEASSVLERAVAHRIDSLLTHAASYELAFLNGNAGTMAQEADWASGRPGAEDLLLAYEADTAAYNGHFAQANDVTARSVASARRAGEKETAATYQAEAALRDALVGNAVQAQKQATTAWRASNGRHTQAMAALALAVAGNTAQAQNLADDLAKRFPQDTIVQFNYLPTIHAAIALGQNSPAKAITELHVTAPYELGTPALLIFLNLYPAYMRGHAYLAARQGAAAAAEFQKILDHRGIVFNEMIFPLAHLGLARALAIQAEKQESLKAYQEFLALWKDADPDIPILKQAKAEYAKLQ